MIISLQGNATILPRLLMFKNPNTIVQQILNVECHRCKFLLQLKIIANNNVPKLSSRTFSENFGRSTEGEKSNLKNYLNFDVCLKTRYKSESSDITDSLLDSLI